MKDLREKLRRVRDDPVAFAEVFLDFRPTDYQARFLRDESDVLVAVWSRRAGKTTTTAVKAIHYAFTHGNAPVIIVSPSFRQSRIMFEKVKEFILGSPILRNSVVKTWEAPDLRIKLSNRSEILALPASPDKIRGLGAAMIIVDEANFVDEKIFMAITPMMATVEKLYGFRPKLILLSTPWNKDHYFYQVYLQGKHGEPGITVHEVTADQVPFISKEFLEQEKKRMPEEIFLMEYYCRWPEAITQYIPYDLLNRVIDPALRICRDIDEMPPDYQTSPLYLGLDLGKLHDYSAAVILQKQGDQYRAVLTRLWPLRTPYGEVVGWVKRAVKHLPINMIAIDRGGVGEPVYEELKKTLGVKLLGIIFTERKKEALLSDLKAALQQEKIWLPDYPPLKAHILAEKVEITKSGHLKFYHDESKTHDDLLFALALAYHATKGPGIVFTSLSKW